MQKEQWKNNKLKEYRLKAGLTQKQVAEKLGMQCEDGLSR
jgi:DNA-binding XRE family transcriptional regulator